MKVLPFKIPKPEQECLIYQEDCEEVFYDKFHQHEEIQISYIVKGTGLLILGDSISKYEPGDIIMIGANIPHVFKSDTERKSQSLMFTLFFTRDSFGEQFFNLSEFDKAHKLLDKAKYGIKIKPTNKKIYKFFNDLKEQNKIERIASFLNILNILINSKKESLSTFVYHKKYTDNEGKRMDDVFEFTIDNFKESISLDDIARKANMSKNAFCRYFKKRTNKTFFQFLIEVRVEHASKLLVRDRELPVSILYQKCGFNNLANFNRKFKELKGMTPTQYRLNIEGDHST